MSFACCLYPIIFYLYVVIYHSYVSHMYSYMIRMQLVCTHMSLICTRKSSVCHSYVLVCHLCVTCMYPYAIRMLLVCARMSSVCHSYVLVCHAYVTRMYSYVVWPWIFFSVWLFKVFNIFLVLIILHCLKTCSYIFDFICLSLKREIFKFTAQSCRARVGGGAEEQGQGEPVPLFPAISSGKIFFFHRTLEIKKFLHVNNMLDLIVYLLNET